MWSLEGAWGNYQKKADKTQLNIVSGSLKLSGLELPYLDKVSSVSADGKTVGFTFEDGKLSFNEPVTVQENIIVQ